MLCPLLSLLGLCLMTGLALKRNVCAGKRLFAGTAPWVGVVFLGAWAVHLALAAHRYRWLATTRTDCVWFAVHDAGELAESSSVGVTAKYDRDARPFPWASQVAQAREVTVRIDTPKLAEGTCFEVHATREEDVGYEIVLERCTGSRRSMSCLAAPGAIADAVGTVLKGWAPTNDHSRNTRAIQEAVQLVERLVLGDLDLSAWGLDRDAVERQTSLGEVYDLGMGWPRAENTVMATSSLVAIAWMGITMQRPLASRKSSGRVSGKG